MGNHASPHHLNGISRAHGDPRRRPDAARLDKTSASFCAILKVDQTKRKDPVNTALIMATFVLPMAVSRPGADAGTRSQRAKSRGYYEASLARLAYTYIDEIDRPSIRVK